MENSTRSAVRAALAAFGVPSPRFRLLAHRHNAVFDVRTETGGRLALRMARAGCRSAAELESEAVWLTALRHESLVLPQPVVSTDGRYAVCIEMPPSSAPCRFLLFRWVDGRVTRTPSRPQARAMGSLLARLHLAGGRFISPQGFQRARYDHQGVAGDAVGVPTEQARGKLSASELAAVDAATARVADIFEAPRGPQTWGILHGDFTLANVLFLAGEARAIDFDDMGWGYFAYDVAITSAALVRMSEETRRAFLMGYDSVRPGALEGMDLPAFIAARHLYSVLWLAGHYLDGPHHTWARRSIDWRVNALRSWFFS